MALLQHGFVDRRARRGFKPDETDPLSYGIIKWRGAAFPTAAAIVLGAVILAIVLAAILF